MSISNNQQWCCRRCPASSRGWQWLHPHVDGQAWVANGTKPRRWVCLNHDLLQRPPDLALRQAESGAERQWDGQGPGRGHIESRLSPEETPCVCCYSRQQAVPYSISWYVSSGRGPSSRFHSVNQRRGFRWCGSDFLLKPAVALSERYTRSQARSRAKVGEQVCSWCHRAERESKHRPMPSSAARLQRASKPRDRHSPGASTAAAKFQGLVEQAPAFRYG
jgi:hypothetical protein